MNKQQQGNNYQAFAFIVLCVGLFGLLLGFDALSSKEYFDALFATGAATFFGTVAIALAVMGNS